MWFLLTQIFFYLLLSALLGAGLAWWWMKRRYEDVTETHEYLMQEREQITQDDLKAGFDRLKLPDIEPVKKQLAQIERRILEPDQSMDALLSRLQDLEANMSSVADTVSGLHNTNIEPIETRLSELSNTLRETEGPDLEPIEIRLARIEGAIKTLPIPEIDLGPLHSGLAQMEMAVSGLELPETDLEPVHNHLRAVETRIKELDGHLEVVRKADTDELKSELTDLSSRISALPMPDIESVLVRLGSIERAVEKIHMPETDLGPVYDKIDRLKADLAAPDPDAGIMLGQLAGLETAIGTLRNDIQGLPSLDPLETRLANVQTTLMRLPQPDLGPVLNAMRVIESRLDMGALENRLTAIEYGLAAMHHMLRSKREPSVPYTLQNDFTPAGQMTGLTPAMEETMPVANAVPPRASDPINPARRPDDRANLLVEAAFGNPDDLEHISGIGPMLRQLLNEVGVYYFWQISEWSPADVEWVDNKLMHFKGRIERDNWVEQAQNLAAHPASAKRPTAFASGAPRS